MSHISEMIELMDNYEKHLMSKIEKYEIDDEFGLIFNRCVDAFLEIYRGLFDQASFYPIKPFSDFTEVLVTLINLINEKRISEAIYFFLENFVQQLYLIKGIALLHTYSFSLNQENSYTLLSISDHNTIQRSTVIDFDEIKNIEYDFLNILSKDYNLIKTGLISIGVNEEKILPSSYPKNNSIETFRLDLYLRLENRNFSIVSDDCWAGFVYKQLGLEYNTPFMWMFFRNRDYLKLIGDLPLYLNSKLEFVEIPGVNYPVGLLNDIHIYFNHYRSKEEAEAKWKKRLKKFNWDNIYFKMTTTNEEDVSEFNKILSYTNNKVSFSFDEYKFPSNVSMSGWRNPDIRKRYVGFYQYLHLHSNDYFNYVDWLNGKSNNK